jgi:hypothetical protein
MQIQQSIFFDSSLTSAWNGLANIQPQLLLVFGAPAFFTPGLAGAIQQNFPQATILGCSTAGEIYGTAVYENALVITAIHFDHAGFMSASAPLGNIKDSQAAGARLAARLVHKDLHSVLVYAPGLAINGSAVINGMSSVLPSGVRITGGLAGDNGVFQKTFTMLNGQVSDHQLVAVGFYEPGIKCHHGSFGGWLPFGPARKVTGCIGNELLELDGQPALDIYRQYLGEYSSQLPASGLLFPFENLDKEQMPTGVIRTILGINETKGSLVLAGDIKSDGYLRLMHASIDGLIEGARTAAMATRTALTSNNPALAILVSCVGRRLVMGSRVDEEVETVAEVFGPHCSIAGFYSYGEISPLFASTESKLHNQTMTVTYMVEE